MGAQPTTIWDSLATLLDLLKRQPDTFGPVQAEYRTALISADAARLHYILALIQQQADRHTSALLSLEQAEVLIADRADPLLPPALIAWAAATSQFALGNPEGALQQLHHALLAPAPLAHASPSPHAFAHPPDRSEVVLRVTELYRSMGNLPAAEQALTEARALLPDDTAIATALADIYVHQGKLLLALAQLDELALRYEARQQLDRALELLEHAHRLAPSHAAIGMRLARLQLRRGYLDRGVAGLIQVAELAHKAGQLRESVAALQEVAQVYWMVGNLQQVRVICARVMQIAPGDLEARQWLALIYTLMHQTPDAIATKKWLAHRFVQQQNYPQAIAELHQIIALDQRDLEAYMLLGDLLTRQGEAAQAERIYARMRTLMGVDHEHDHRDEHKGSS
jgi:tetratricopeptide (TPR) repeat protein